jgi:iron(III) transport system permease protein
VDWLGQARFAGVVLLQALALYPILYLNVTAALVNIDPAMEEAAANLGAGPWRRLWRITLPLAAPGLFAGGALVFIWSFTELGTPLMLNYTRCAPVQIFDALKEIGDSPFPHALVLVMLTASVLLYAGAHRAFGRRAWAMQNKATSAAAPLRRATGWRGALIAAPFVIVIALALLPHIAVILTSISQPGSWYRTALPASLTLDHFREALGNNLALDSLRNSAFYALLAVATNLVLGVAIALVVVRSDLRLRGWLDTLAMLPMAVPGLVMAFGYLAVSAALANQGWVKESPFWRALLDVRTNPTLFLAIAYSIRRLPYMVRAAVAGLNQTAVVFEEAAANLGAGPWTRFRRITLPLISANLIAGALLTFAFSMLEVSDSLILAQRQDFYPVTKAIYELYQLIGTGKYLAAALGVWAMALLALALAGSNRLLGKKLGALFRV